MVEQECRGDLDPRRPLNHPLRPCDVSACGPPTRSCSRAQPGMLSPNAKALGSGPQSCPVAHEVSGGACNAAAVARTGGGGGKKGREGSGC